MIFYNYKNKPHSSKKEVSLIPKINIKNIYIYIYILWGQRIWVPRPISNNKPKSPVKEENVQG